LGWVGSYLPLIVPSFLGGGAFNIFLLRQFFRAIPGELDDAARIDGAGFFQVFRHVVLPQSVPALVTVGLFDFVSKWNDFFGPVIYLNEARRFTLPLGLAAFRDIYGNTRWNLLMADSLLATLPMVIIFFLFQRVFIQGIVTSGVKG
jgi:multiple sugar transport system permease protein